MIKDSSLTSNGLKVKQHKTRYGEPVSTCKAPRSIYNYSDQLFYKETTGNLPRLASRPAPIELCDARPGLEGFQSLNPLRRA